jgi:hypothetical protein
MVNLADKVDWVQGPFGAVKLNCAVKLDWADKLNWDGKPAADKLNWN